MWLSTPVLWKQRIHDPRYTLHRYAHFNGAFFLVAAYGCYYILLERFAGLSWSLCIGLPIWISSEAFQQEVPNAWAWALGIHVLSWFMQIVPGHSCCEHRKPALLDSLFQVGSGWLSTMAWLYD